MGVSSNQNTARSARSGRSGKQGHGEEEKQSSGHGAPVLPRLGVGYDAPGALDCFADGTPPVGRSLPAFWIKEEERATVTRKRKKTMDPEFLNLLHRKLHEATSKAVGNDWSMLFSNADKDASGTLELDELRRLVRTTLKIPPTGMSNDMVKQLFQVLDYNDNGSIETHEFETFLKHGADVMRTENQAEDPNASREATPRPSIVEANPAAGTVRAREVNQPFLQHHVREIRMENKRAMASTREKLIFELAKQTQLGLSKHLGVHYEMTSVANVVRLAIQNEHLHAAEIDALPNAADVRKAKEVLKAVRSYNLKKVATLLEIDVPRTPTWGSMS